MVPLWRWITSVDLRVERPPQPPATTRELPSTAHPGELSLLARSLSQVDPGLHPKEEEPQHHLQSSASVARQAVSVGRSQ